MLQTLVAFDSKPGNGLLAALPGSDWQRMLCSLRIVVLETGQRLSESSMPIDHVYFPSTAVVALICGMADGASGGIALVGNEGMVGIAQFLGGTSTQSHAVVQSGGSAYVLSAASLRQECRRGGALQHGLLRYTQALIAQMAQTAVCNRYHSIERQLCRWLLLSLDRAPTSTVSSTHEGIAQMLGVRREGVTEAAGRVQRAGAIHYHRGQIEVINRALLEARCCECYGVVRREYARLLGQTASRPPSIIQPKPAPLVPRRIQSDAPRTQWGQ